MLNKSSDTCYFEPAHPQGTPTSVQPTRCRAGNEAVVQGAGQGVLKVTRRLHCTAAAEQR